MKKKEQKVVWSINLTSVFGGYDVVALSRKAIGYNSIVEDEF